MILNKGIWRDFKANFFRNFAMILIIALSMALVVALCSSSDSIEKTIRTAWAICNVEDGSFETYVPLSNRNFKELSKLDAVVEPMFYFDADADSGTVLRLFANRSKIDIPYAESGRLPTEKNDLFLEKLFAENHGIAVGDSIKIDNYIFSVCGTGTFPDYCYVKQNTGDVAANDAFSVAAVTGDTWNRLQGTHKTVFNYAYTLGETCTVQDLKKKLIHLKFDETTVKDTYLKGQIAEAKSAKDEFNRAADGLKGTSGAVADGIDKLGNALSDAGLGSKSEIGTDRLRDGALSVASGINELQKEVNRYLEQGGETKFVNLSSFSEAKYNIRITDALDDSSIGRQAALAAGVILLVLLVYMLSVFASGTIERERPVIGTLYALGYSRKEILSHYMKIPMIVAFSGAAIGAVTGFLLTDSMAGSYSAMYSFPELTHVYPLYLVAYALGMPTVFSYAVNRLVLSGKLNETPLAMMRGTAKSSGAKAVDLGSLSFETRYKVRQFLRSVSGNVTLFFGMVTAILLILFSVACYGSIKGYVDDIASDVQFNYMYVLRNPVTDLPKNSCVGYSRGFYVDYPLTRGEMEVSLLGIDSDNPYFGFAPTLSEDADKIYMSDSARIKFGYKVGDKVILRDNAGDSLYAFEIAGEVPYGSGLYFFMNIDAMRHAFGLKYFDKEDLKAGERRPKSETFYYNTVFSDSKMNFKHNMLLAEISKADMQSGASKFMTLMWDMILMLIGVSVIIFMAVMYLLMKLEIDRSSFSVSLLKALGYSKRVVNSFYLNSSFGVMTAAVVIGIPVCRVLVGVLYPFCVSNVNAGFPARVSPLQYGIVVLIVFFAYFATRVLLVRYLRKIKLTEILKNRE